MTNWLPQLTRTKPPLYREIADALAGDIAGGRLPAGSRLPTHRDLAWRLQVTVGTVSRAYAEAERRGLIGGTVGRGTFVLPTGRNGAALGGPADAGGVTDLSLNYALTGSETGALTRALAALAVATDLGRLMRYQPHAGRGEDRAAGADWLRLTGLATAHPETTILTNGGQHAIAVLLSALTRHGDAIAVEQLTYPGFKAAAQQSGVQLVGIAMDEAGLRPDALDAACRTRTIRLLYVMPTLHNPTTVTMPEERRSEIAAVCRRYDMAVIEDDVWGFLCERPLPPVASLLPEQGYYLASLSKSLAPGLRIGFVHAPGRAVGRLEAAIRASTYMVPPLMAAIATRWIRDGTAERLASEKREVAALRQPMAQRILGDPRLGAILAGDPGALHCWLLLPPGRDADEFAAAARQRGVGITPGSAFAAGFGAANVEAVRVCLGTPASTERLERALQVLAATLTAGSGSHLSVV
jgi:DNA-binding transcriptional MocR family regulator